MALKKKHEEHENHERWIVSYADFITLLFAFFVVLYASSRVDANKLAQTAESFRWALNFKGNGGIDKMALFKGPPTEGGCVTNLGNAAPTTLLQKAALDGVRKRIDAALRTVLQPSRAQQTVKMELENGRLRLRLAASGFFDAASAALRPESMPVLDAIAQELVREGFPIRVEGHTDDAPIRSPRFRNNWELSASRAATVVTYLEEAHHIPPVRLAAAGLGQSHPLRPNESEADREANRRIELVVELPPLDARAPRR